MEQDDAVGCPRKGIAGFVVSAHELPDQPAERARSIVNANEDMARREYMTSY